MQSIARVCVLGNRRSASKRLVQRRRYTTGAPDPSTLKSNMNVMKIGVQTIFAGTEALEPFVAELKTYSRRPLIVTDEGISKIGLVQQFVDALKKAGLQPTVFDKCVPNPTTGNTIGIAQSFFQGTCDAVVGLGGGGPLDAAKAGMALVAQKRVDAKFDLERDGHKFIQNIRPFMSGTMKENPKAWEQFSTAVPAIAGIPTTAGTGSEGGKSAVITLPDGVKLVFGNPVFMPKTVALVPQFTQKLPAGLTAGTGIDALFHNMEAFFVTYKAALNDGMNDAEIAYTDDFALKGISLIVDNLPNAVKNGNDLNTRLKMQVAALYGAKAFRKGDLGGIHATAHALGAFYHLHHGTAIARMSVPVLKYNAERMSDETRKAFGTVHEIFKKGGYAGATLAESTAKFISPLGIPLGLKELPVKAGDLDKLANIAANDPCQTNPVPLKEADYRAIFEDANKM